jgi:hypothetical protein
VTTGGVGLFRRASPDLSTKTGFVHCLGSPHVLRHFYAGLNKANKDKGNFNIPTISTTSTPKPTTPWAQTSSDGYLGRGDVFGFNRRLISVSAGQHRGARCAGFRCFRPLFVNTSVSASGLQGTTLTNQLDQFSFGLGSRIGLQLGHRFSTRPTTGGACSRSVSRSTGLAWAGWMPTPATAINRLRHRLL